MARHQSTHHITYKERNQHAGNGLIFHALAQIARILLTALGKVFVKTVHFVADLVRDTLHLFDNEIERQILKPIEHFREIAFQRTDIGNNGIEIVLLKIHGNFPSSHQRYEQLIVTGKQIGRAHV